MTDKAQIEWVARHILPHEADLRVWLKRFSGIEVDDIVQESYMRLLERDISTVRQPRAYFFTVARNIVLEHYRRARIVPIDSLADFSDSTIIDDGPATDDVIDARQELRRLDTMVQRLPTRCRHVFILRKIEGLSRRQVSDRLGLTENVVEKQLARALVLLGRTFIMKGQDQHDIPSRESRKPKKHSRFGRN